MTDSVPAATTPAPVMGLYDRPMWQSIRDKAMQLQCCEPCRIFLYPPAPVCPHCLDAGLRWMPLSGKGTIVSWTVFHKSYLDAYPAPYNVIAVKLAEGPTIISNLKGALPEGSWIGKPVQLTYSTMPDGAVLPTFALAQAGDKVHSAPHVAIRPEWLALHDEPIIEPSRPIIDAHHHLWEFPDKRYLGDDLRDDIGSGHAVRATVFVECRTHYRTDGKEASRPVGEVAFAVQEGARWRALAHAPDARLCAAVVGYADLSLGTEVQPVLADLVSAGQGRLRSIRNVSVWHADPSVRASAMTPPAGLLRDPGFRDGFAALRQFDLSFDAWLIHTQLDDLCDLAASFPETPIVLNHVGGPLALGPYRGRREAVFAEWREGMRRLSECGSDKVFVKIGGFGMPLFGFDFHERATPPDSETVAASIGPYVDACIALFGAERCMFESNFPVDKGSFSYDVLWNAYKRVVRGASEAEKAALFSGTASRFYRIDID